MRRLLALATTTAGAAENDAIVASRILPYCKLVAADKPVTIEPDEFAAHLTLGGICTGGIEGVVWTLSPNRLFGAEELKRRNICIQVPKNIDINEKARAVARYIETLPPGMADRADFPGLVALALHDAWPCK